MSTLSGFRQLYPYPTHAEWGEDFLEIGKDLIVAIPQSLSESSRNSFGEYWNGFSCGLGSLSFAEESSDHLYFRIGISEKAPELPLLSNADTYAITVNREGIAASAVNSISLAHAWSTFLQLTNPRRLEKGKEAFALPYVTVHDSPALRFRGIHFCIFPETSLSRISRMVLMASLMKYSHVVLEFWGMLKLDAMPELAWQQAYSQEEIKPILDAARGMGVEIIPMMNHWGHASASRLMYGRHVVLDQNPRHALLFEPDGWTWCLSNPDTRKLLADVRNELIDFAGEGEYFHIGCDEAFSHATCDRCRNSDAPRLLADYINEIAADLNSRNRRPIVWGDALLEEGKWAPPVMATSRPDQKTRLALKHLSRDIVIADWQYDIKEGDVPTLEHFEQQGFDVLACPWSDPQNIKTLGAAAVKRKSFGFLQTTWNTVPRRIKMLLQGSTAGWLHEESAYDLAQYHPLTSYTAMASLMRKVAPVHGEYANAGWSDFEVEGH